MKKYWWPGVVFVLALALHLWHLGTIHSLISDEFYFVQESEKYLTHTYYIDAHPPLGKLQEALVYTWFGFSPFTWRIIGAIEGALLIPVVWWLVRLVTRSKISAHIAAGFLLFDGFTLVDSRTGMINIPYILYALLAVVFILVALEKKHWRWWLAAAGTMIGLAISDKWLAALTFLPGVALWFWPQWFGWKGYRLSQAQIFESVIWLVVWPIMLYLFIWEIHFAWLGIKPRVIWTNLFMWYHHTHGKTGHPYAFPWLGWLAMWRPFLYWVRTTGGTISVIWSMPNPVLWYSGVVAMVYSLIKKWKQPAFRLVTIFLLANWIPFAAVRREMFSYHAIPFSIFLIVLLAMVVSDWWPNKKIWLAMLSAAIVASWLFFWPWFTAQPLTPAQYRWRAWLPTWNVKAVSLEDQRSLYPPAP